MRKTKVQKQENRKVREVMKKRLKDKKGITLIALVITIIVLLILAGVAISMLSGDNGILNRATQAKDETEIKGILEKIQLAVTASMLNKDATIEENTLDKELTDYFGTNGYNKTPKGNGWIIKVGESEFEVSSTGKVKQKTIVVADTLGIEPTYDESQMTPVVYDETKKEWVEADVKTQNNWFDYSNQKWANVETENGYFVYVPRYAYKIESTSTTGYHTNTAVEISIVFLDTENNPLTEKDSKEKSVSKSDLVTADQVDSYTLNTEKNATTKYIIHPAFTELDEGENKVAGIWVAKYEASRYGATATTGGTSAVTSGENQTQDKIMSVPGVTSWRSIQVSDIFTKCLNMNTSLNSHMMKNTEWGAVAYLATSKYGRVTTGGEITEVSVNQCSGYVTGAGPSISEVYGSSYYAYNQSNFNSTYAYNTTRGKLASTTGNVYGIYDLSGGAYEYVAGYVENDYTDPAKATTQTNSRYSYNKSMIDNTIAKYVNKYLSGANASTPTTDTNDNNYAANKLRVGDAVYETSLSGNGSANSWNSDFSRFPYTNNPVFKRGGYYVRSASNAGLFYFNFSNGDSYDVDGFRPVCLVY